MFLLEAYLTVAPPGLILHLRRTRTGTVGPISLRDSSLPAPLTPGTLTSEPRSPTPWDIPNWSPSHPSLPALIAPALTCELACIFNLVWNSLTTLDRTPLSPEGVAWLPFLVCHSSEMLASVCRGSSPWHCHDSVSFPPPLLAVCSDSRTLSPAPPVTTLALPLVII